MSKIQEIACKVEAFYFKPNLNRREIEFCRMPVGINTLNKVLPELCVEAGLIGTQNIAQFENHVRDQTFSK